MNTFMLLQFASATLLILDSSPSNFSFRKRMLAERSLQEASTEVRDLYNNAPCGYHSLDDKGMITEMNHTGLQWLGLHARRRS